MNTLPETAPRSRTLLFWAALALNLAALVWLASFATLYMVTASIAYTAMFWGMVLRKQRMRHVSLMNFAICLDIALVLLLEFKRSAIAEALEFSMNPLQQAHIGASTIAVLLYFPVLYLGWGLYRGKLRTTASRDWHLRLGITAFIFRTAGFLLMFSMLSHVLKR